MKAYSEDLRKRIVEEAVERGMGKNEAAGTFGVSLGTFGVSLSSLSSVTSVWPAREGP
jgi:transposase